MVEQSPEEADAAWRRVRRRFTGEEFAPMAHDAFAITQALAFDREQSLVACVVARIWRATMPARCASSSRPKCGNISTSSICGCSRSRRDAIWVHHPARTFPRGAGRFAHAGRRHLFDPAATAKAGTSWNSAAISSGRSCVSRLARSAFPQSRRAASRRRNISTGWCC